MMKKYDKLIYYISLITFVIYQLLFVNSTLKLYTYPIFIKAIKYLGYMGLFYSIMIQRKKTTYWGLEFGILTVGIVIYFLTNELKIFEYFLVIFASKDKKFDDIVKVLRITLITLTIFIISLSLLKIIPNYVFYRNMDSSYRYGLGFTYVSQIPAIILELIFFEVYSDTQKKDKVKIFKYLFIVVILLLVYYITRVRNILMVGFLFILLSFTNVLNMKFLKKKIIKNIICMTYIICFTISLLCSINYDSTNQVWVKANEISSSRLKLSHELTQKYNVRLFGNKITMYGTSATTYGGIDKSEYFYIDNLYMQLLYKDGIVISVIFALLNTYYFIQSFKNDNKTNMIFIVWLLSISLYSILGDTAKSIVFNLPMLAIYEINTGRNKLVEKEN